MSLIKTEAFVLKSINWRDTSKIVSLYSREAGRVDVIAKGARRKNHPHGSFLESLNHLEVIIYVSEKRELQNLGNTTQINSFHNIRQDLDKTSFGLAILEIINLFFSPGETDTVFFDFLVTQLNALNETKQPQVIFWFFILKISSYLGFKPYFDNCRSCKKLKDEDHYFQITSGATYCKDCAGENINFIHLTSKLFMYLNRLQKANHKNIVNFPAFSNENLAPFNFLLSYLRHHTEQKLELSSLKLLK